MPKRPDLETLEICLGKPRDDAENDLLRLLWIREIED
jgi:hypothetical protein